jgi:hypothetical protein
VEDTALLTDDEIVALCAADGRPWPIGLNTVEPSVEELSKAGIRGMRSLMVRRLAGGDAERPGVRPHEMIARDVAAFLDATERVGAYLAPAADHSRLGGASVTAARTDQGWVVDTATAAGVHALRTASTDDAAHAVLELAEKAYRGELFDDDAERSRWVCVVRFGPAGQNAVAVGPDSVTGFIDGRAVEFWDSVLIRAAFGRT